MTPARRIVLLAALAAFCLWPALAAVAAEGGRSLAFNKQNVFMYFKQVEDAKNKLPENLDPRELHDRECLVYATVLKQGGYEMKPRKRKDAEIAPREHAPAVIRTMLESLELLP